MNPLELVLGAIVGVLVGNRAARQRMDSATYTTWRVKGGSMSNPVGSESVDGSPETSSGDSGPSCETRNSGAGIDSLLENRVRGHCPGRLLGWRGPLDDECQPRRLGPSGGRSLGGLGLGRSPQTRGPPGAAAPKPANSGGKPGKPTAWPRGATVRMTPNTGAKAQRGQADRIKWSGRAGGTTETAAALHTMAMASFVRGSPQDLGRRHLLPRVQLRPSPPGLLKRAARRPGPGFGSR